MSDESTTLSVARVESYLDITRRASAKATPMVVEGSPEGAHLATMLRMADDYASDAGHFLANGRFGSCLLVPSITPTRGSTQA